MRAQVLVDDKAVVCQSGEVAEWWRGIPAGVWRGCPTGMEAIRLVAWEEACGWRLTPSLNEGRWGQMNGASLDSQSSFCCQASLALCSPRRPASDLAHCSKLSPGQQARFLAQLVVPPASCPSHPKFGQKPMRNIPWGHLSSAEYPRKRTPLLSHQLQAVRVEFE